MLRILFSTLASAELHARFTWDRARQPDDIAFATRVDAFDFAMEATRDASGRLRLART